METSYKTEIFGSVSSGKYTPFQMVNHSWGMVPLNANNFHLRSTLFHEQNISQEWSFDLGLDIAASNASVYNNDFWLQQIFIDLNWKFLKLTLGSKENYWSLLDPYLSSGDFIRSNNSRPMPEINISIPEFTLIPYTKGNVYIKADFAIGKYLDNQYVANKMIPLNGYYSNNLLSHHKSFYLRFGNIEKENRLQFIFGLNHDAQWGGTVHRYDWNKNEYVTFQDPRNFTDLLRVIVAKEGSSSSSFNDSLYVAGAHAGAYLFKFDYKLNNKDFLSLYLSHFFEDGSGLAFLNYQDMLLGLQYKSEQKRLVSGVVFEYIYTKNQTGPIGFGGNEISQHRGHNNRNGADNYYNHGIYTQGYSYFGRCRGNPLLLSPEYNEDEFLGFKSNRIIAFHLGMEGFLLPLLQYRLTASTGQSWGTYENPHLSVQDGYSAGLDIIYAYPKVKGLDFKLSLACNSGEFFKESAWGGGITITKRGVILKK